MRNRLSILTLIIFGLIGCKSTSNIDYSKIDYDGPPTIIYQTKADYSALVPITLNAEKTKIVAYPGPKDLFNQEGELRFPLALDEGFYLDEIGIGINSAFISLTINQYAHLMQLPSADSLFKLIVDKDPFKKMYDLGNRKHYIGKNDSIREIVKRGKYKKYKDLMR